MNPEKRVERVAHRGAPRELVENTLPAFRRALERGADAIELDVHRSNDGVVVVHHDFACRGRELARTPWSDLARLDLGSGASMPRLQDVLGEVGDRATVYIEVKGRDIEEAVIATARAHGRRFAFHSFDHDAIARVAALAPDLPRGVLLDRGIPAPVPAMRNAVRRTGARDVWPHWTIVDQEFMDAARELSTRVIPWTVNSAATARSLADAGVAGICSDDVRLLAGL